MPQSKVFIHRAKHSLLLVSLALLILISPLFDGERFGHFVIDALFSLVLLSAVNASSETRHMRLTAWVIALLSLGLMWANVADQTTTGRLIGVGLFVALSATAIALVLRSVIKAPSVTFEVLCAGVGLYLLLGVTWALTYVLLDGLNPQAFEVVSANLETGWTDFLYFSFATLTTLGYGDISPDAPFVRIWAVMEAVTGVLYIAILVARLVSLYRA
jgi:hypothetical protein